MRKLDRFIKNARIKGSNHVLEIGAGQGSLAIRAVQKTGY
jgi:cyclopropane-fatty-acyl-phospholipid synthase